MKPYTGMRPMAPRSRTRSGWLRTGALAIALATGGGAQAAQSSAGASAPDVATDPAAAWSYFLTHAEAEKAFSAYEALDAVGYTATAVDAALCRNQAARLRDAVATTPVSVALHRAAMLCAEAIGDEATAEHELAALAGLVRHALGSASDSAEGRPIRVLRSHDIRAVVETAGLEPLYARYPYWRVFREFPLVVAAWDPQRKVERHLRFDYVDAMQALFRSPDTRYPSLRSEIIEAVLKVAREAGIPEAIDAMAWKEARLAGDPAARIEKLRMGATAGGMQSARVWLLACGGKSASPGCADGLVDTLLPLAEKQWGYATMLLAHAYANGIGVPVDAAAAERLLDAADARWVKHGATVEYARLWQESHDGEPLPALLAHRLERAEAAGNEDARSMRIARELARDPAKPLDAGDIAFLSRSSQNGQGAGYALLADWAEERKSADDQQRWRRLAADAGDPQSQFNLGFDLAYGEKGPKNPAAARPYFVEAAHGANTMAARSLAWEAGDAHDYAAAEKWLTDPATRSFDVQALLDIGRLYEWNRPGVSGNAERAIALYRDLAAQGVAEARRRLALMAANGRNMPKDGAQARAWLEVDAGKGDHESESLLGIGLLMGQFGEVDEREGVRWVERALAGGDRNTSASYGLWLFRKGTPASRAKAVEVWLAGIRNKDDGAANNYAWALCTAPVPEFIDGKAGLATAAEMGPVDDLPWGEQDTVAACRAAAGDFAGAAALQKRVVESWAREIAGENATAESREQMQKLQARLALYEAGKPFVEPPEDRG